MDLESLIYQQNPQWNDLNYQKPEESWFHRPFFKESLSWIDKRLVIALTGLRRCGKSTLLKQVKYHLEKKVNPQRILYFSFEKSQVKFHPDVLRQILNWYLESYLKQSLTTLDRKIYIFLDEIQYIPYWQDVVKTYYDQSQNIKFFLSGSSSLFIKKRALESLAGRIADINIIPLQFAEYLKLKNINTGVKLKNQFAAKKQIINSYFEEYLSFGQFPELVKEKYTKEQSIIYLSSIEEKIIEQDLPKLYKIERIDILRLIFNHLKTHPGQIMEYKNIIGDLGIDLKTVRKYFEYLNKSYLISFCQNQTRKPVKSARTAKKIYLSSTNFAYSNTGWAAENYVYNQLSGKNGVKFFRKGDFEVDFVISKEEKKYPVEVKYQEKIEDTDYKNLLTLAKKLHSPSAYLITKNLYKNEVRNEIKISSIPVSLLEEEIDF